MSQQESVIEIPQILSVRWTPDYMILKLGQFPNEKRVILTRDQASKFLDDMIEAWNLMQTTPKEERRLRENNSKIRKEKKSQMDSRPKLQEVGKSSQRGRE